MLTIGVDIDLTIVPSDVYWEAWLKRHFEQISEIPKENADYNLGKYFKESKNGLKHMDFWDNPHLYDEMELLPGCYDALKALKESGHNLLFISHTRSGHFSSKFRLLSKLPFLEFESGSKDGFIATKEKGVLSPALNIMIDDRNKFLNQFYDVKTVLFETRYTQDETPKVYDLQTSNWGEIVKYINKIDEENKCQNK